MQLWVGVERWRVEKERGGGEGGEVFETGGHLIPLAVP